MKHCRHPSWTGYLNSSLAGFQLPLAWLLPRREEDSLRPLRTIAVIISSDLWPHSHFNQISSCSSSFFYPYKSCWIVLLPVPCANKKKMEKDREGERQTNRETWRDLFLQVLSEYLKDEDKRFNRQYRHGDQFCMTSRGWQLFLTMMPL